jgi:ABC-2 type transport system ATP-binding protein
MIEVDHITKFFGPIPAVKDVSFEVKKGEILGFLGPNGAGKTTTMRIMTGFWPPSSGSARIAGMDVFENSLAVRKKIGYLPENVPLYYDMFVEPYLSFVAEVKGLSGAAKKSSVGKAIEACGLESVRKRPIKVISKGYKQRVGLAQALVGNPEVLILDEPTIGLDPKQIADIRGLIKSLSGEMTIILSTHVLPEVSMTCDRVVIINKGTVVAEDTPANLSRELAGAGRVRLKSSGEPAELIKTVSAISGVSNIRGADEEGVFLVETGKEIDVLPKMAAAVIKAGFDLYELTPISASLEDVFLNVITNENEKVITEEATEVTTEESTPLTADNEEVQDA